MIKFFRDDFAGILLFAICTVFLNGIVIQFFPSHDGLVMANLLGVIASGIATTTQVPTFSTVHQFLYFEIATTPQSIKVNVNGDTLITDLDTAGLNVLKNIRSNGPYTNAFLIQMATGMITGVNVDVTVVNNVASAFNIYGMNRRRQISGTEQYVQSLGINLNAGQSFDIVNFIYCGLPSAASADIINIYGRGNRQVQTREFSAKQELETIRGILQLYENQASALKSCAFDNYDGDITRINFIPVASQKIYIQRVVPVGSQVTASLLS